MSIINQVLHDLDARQSRSLGGGGEGNSEGDEAWSDLAWHNGAGTVGIAGQKLGGRFLLLRIRRLFWRIASVSIIVILAVAVAVMFYQQYGVSADDVSNNTKSNKAQSAKKSEKTQKRYTLNNSKAATRQPAQKKSAQARKPASTGKQNPPVKSTTRQAAVSRPAPTVSGKKLTTPKQIVVAGGIAASSQPVFARTDKTEQLPLEPAAEPIPTQASHQEFAMLDNQADAYNHEAVTEPGYEPADPNAGMNKKVRPLSKAQLAELAYQAGYTLIKRNHLAAGEAKLQIALRNDVRHIKAREMLIGMYVKTGRKVEAKTLLKQGLLNSPGYTNFAKFYARMLWDEKNIPAAIAVLTRYAPRMDVDPDYHAMLAASLQRNEQHRDAARIYVQLLKIRPREGIWWVGMAISLEALGKEEEALQAYVKAKQSGNLNARLESYSKQRLISLAGAVNEQQDSDY